MYADSARSALRRGLAWLAPSSAAVLALACTGNFDPALYQARESDAGRDAFVAAVDAGMQEDAGEVDGGTMDAGVDAALEDAGVDASVSDTGPVDANASDANVDGGPPPFVLGEYCAMASSVPRIVRPTDPTVRVSVSYAIDTTTLADDVRDVAGCTGRPDPGNDGFLIVQMNAGERWHFHVRRPTAMMNPAIYVLGADCDERTCMGSAGLDVCGASSDEHFSYVATATGDYFVGIDATSAGGFAATLDVIRPVCGNTTREHSEGCDDGNRVPGDGCDASCRAELAAGAEEVEANDDIYAANHIVSTGSVTVLGHVTSACEIDNFAFDVPASSTARVAVTAHLSLSTGTCPVDAATPITLELVSFNGSTILGTATLGAGGGCLDVATTVPADLMGRPHFVRVRSINADFMRPLDYRIDLTFTPA